MDWIRLGHSGKDLTGVGGKKMMVSREELSKHNKRDDAWMAFRGIYIVISIQVKVCCHELPFEVWHVAFEALPES